MKFLKYTLITTITVFSFLTSYEAKKETVKKESADFRGSSEIPEVEI